MKDLHGLVYPKFQIRQIKLPAWFSVSLRGEILEYAPFGCVSPGNTQRVGSQEGGSLSLTGEPVGENPKQGKPAFLTQRSKSTVSCVMAPVALKKKREERLLLLLLLRRRQKRKARKMLQNRSKRWWVKPVWQMRRQHGNFQCC